METHVFKALTPPSVTPAKAGAQLSFDIEPANLRWIPAFVAMMEIE
jgi:hypothetical protein